MFCSQCGHQLTADSKFCPNCGQKNLAIKTNSPTVQTSTQTVVPVAHHDHNQVGERLTFYSLSPARLFFLSCFTVGIFLIYWFIKNWELIRRQEKINISPFWRGLFSIFYCYQLFKKVLTSAKANGYKTGVRLKSSLFATSYIIFFIFSNGASRAEAASSSDVILHFALWVILFIFAIVPVLYIQNAINYNNSRMVETYQINEPFTGKEVVIIVFGVILFILSMYGWLSEFTSLSNTSSADPPTSAITSSPDTKANNLTDINQTEPNTSQDPVATADYQEGYKSGYTDGRAYESQFGDNFAPPATEERHAPYTAGYINGFLKGCREGNHDCTEVENYINELAQESDPSLEAY